MVLGLLVSSMSIQAQQVIDNYKPGGGVSTGKSVSDNGDGTYKITLETFATGTSSTSTETKPVDVVLVLDVSGSMEQPKGTTTQLDNNTNISYNTIANSDATYFYRDSDGDYDQIYYEKINDQYYLYIDYGSNIASNRKQYITNQGLRTGRPGNAPTDPNSTIFSTNRDRRVQTGKESRLHALKDAVKSFIKTIEHNSLYYKDDTPNNWDDDVARPTDEVVDNRISIIKFSNTNITQALCNLTTVVGNVSSLEVYIDDLKSGGGTYAGSGMDLANTQFADYGRTNADKVVVFFTDGDPSDNYAAIGNTTNGGTNAYRAKNTHKASVFSVGLFTESPKTNDGTWQYLNYVSSNYPNATVSYYGMNAGTGGSDKGFYKDASGDVDLTSIFQDIATSTGQSDETIGASSQIRDVVTSSFTVPSGTASGLKVSVWTVDEDGNDWTLEVENPSSVDAGFTKRSYVENGSTVQKDSLVVTGFDFTKDDTKDSNGFTTRANAGNWVGLRYKSKNESFYAGRKLVIEFNVKPNGDATGGVGTATNTSASGVYIQKTDENGNKYYDNINAYEIPHTTLPVNIKITKDGLRHGESATFQIFRIGPKMVVVKDKDGNPIKSKVDPAKDSLVIDYNAIGKPKPNEHEFDDDGGELDPNNYHDYLEGTGWEKWSKVILTNKGADKAEVSKTLLSLDPNWVYLVSEDDWGWAYTVTGTGQVQTTATVELNPFKFTNTEKTGIVKHAEAVTINHFGYTISGGDFDGKQEEHYKSSKVEKL